MPPFQNDSTLESPADFQATSTINRTPVWTHLSFQTAKLMFGLLFNKSELSSLEKHQIVKNAFIEQVGSLVAVSQFEIKSSGIV